MNEQELKTSNSESLSTEEKKVRVNALRGLILDEKLKKLRTDDVYLLRFLYCTDFDVEKAFKWMKEYCDLLIDHPNWFANGSPTKWRSLVETNSKVMLQQRDKQGRRIFINKSQCVATSKTTMEEQAILDEIWIEAVLNEPETMSTGISYIVDMKGFTYKMLAWMTPHNMRIGKKKESLYPCKDLIYHVVNSNMYMNAGIKIAWPFLSEKVKKKIIFHQNNWESLHQYISPDILPPEYGGTGPQIDYENEKQWLYGKDYDIENSLMYNRIIDTTI